MILQSAAIAISLPLPGTCVYGRDDSKLFNAALLADLYRATMTYPAYVVSVSNSDTWVFIISLKSVRRYNKTGWVTRIKWTSQQMSGCTLY